MLSTGPTQGKKFTGATEQGTRSVRPVLLLCLAIVLLMLLPIWKAPPLDTGPPPNVVTNRNGFLMQSNGPAYTRVTKLDEYDRAVIARSAHPRLLMSFSFFVPPGYNWEPLYRVYMESIEDMGLADMLWRMEISVNYDVPSPSTTAERKAYVSALTAGMRAVTAEHVPIAVVSFYEGNEHEFRGITKVWELAQDAEDPSDLVLYAHGRGITRKRHCTIMMEETMGRHNALRWLFRANAGLDVAGLEMGNQLFPSGYIVWYNFYVARSRHLRTLVKPAKVRRRHYYEGWLSVRAELDPATGLPAHNRSRVTYNEEDGIAPPEQLFPPALDSGYKIQTQSFCDLKSCGGLPKIDEWNYCTPFVVKGAPEPVPDVF